MTQTTNTTTELALESTFSPVTMNTYVMNDFRTSILIVSVVANLIVLTAWLVLQASAQFDGQVASLLFNR